MKRWSLGLLALLLACIASAQSPRALRAQAEMSLLVTGTVDVTREGRVAALEIDDERKLTQEVTSLVRRSAAIWKFEPARRSGEAIATRAKMRLILVAQPVGEGEYRVTIGSARFDDEHEPESNRLTKRNMEPPRYPLPALKMGAKGSVYLALRVDREGAVEDAIAEQVNLRVIGTSQEMERMRRLLAESALDAAREWTFNVPASGPPETGYWVIRVPVDYRLADQMPAYGAWWTYLPGPRQRAPWMSDADAAEAPEALLAGRVYKAGSGMRLLTALVPTDEAG